MENLLGTLTQIDRVVKSEDRRQETEDRVALRAPGIGTL
jgi:hypothetical protein